LQQSGSYQIGTGPQKKEGEENHAARHQKTKPQDTKQRWRAAGELKEKNNTNRPGREKKKSSGGRESVRGNLAKDTSFMWNRGRGEGRKERGDRERRGGKSRQPQRDRQTVLTIKKTDASQRRKWTGITRRRRGKNSLS